MAFSAHHDARMMEELRISPEEMLSKATELANLIRSSSHIVFFTGAGISTSAGVPDFRGPQGVWTLSAQGREREIKETSMTEVVPTSTHMALVQLQRHNKMHFLISQNVDGLHHASGIPLASLAELHGNIHTEDCNKCGKIYWRDFSVSAGTSVAHYTGRKCTAQGCDGDLRDTIINFNENLPAAELTSAFDHAERADLMICLGSSLTVRPACDMPRATKQHGGKVVIVNLQRTPLDDICDVRVHFETDAFMQAVMEKLNLEIPPFVIDRRIVMWRAPEDNGVVSICGVEEDGSVFTCFSEIAVGASAPLQVGGGPLRVRAASDKDIEVEVHFFGHYHEPHAKLCLPAGTPICGYALQWDLQSPEWVVHGFTDGVQPPLLRPGAGPRRTDRIPPPPTGAIPASSQGWFSVTPLKHCPHCCEVFLKPDVVIDVQQPCKDCGNVGENMLCLSCFSVFCGRHVHGHMINHNNATHHPIVAGFADLSFWCYPCEAYIDESNPRLRLLYSLLSRSKFGEGQ